MADFLLRRAEKSTDNVRVFREKEILASSTLASLAAIACAVLNVTVYGTARWGAFVVPLVYPSVIVIGHLVVRMTSEPPNKAMWLYVISVAHVFLLATLPGVLMVQMGSFEGSGGVIIWTAMAPMTSFVLFTNRRTSLIFLALSLVTITAGFAITGMEELGWIHFRERMAICRWHAIATSIATTVGACFYAAALVSQLHNQVVTHSRTFQNLVSEVVPAPLAHKFQEQANQRSGPFLPMLSVDGRQHCQHPGVVKPDNNSEVPQEPLSVDHADSKWPDDVPALPGAVDPHQKSSLLKGSGHCGSSSATGSAMVEVPPSVRTPKSPLLEHRVEIESTVSRGPSRESLFSGLFGPVSARKHPNVAIVSVGVAGFDSMLEVTEAEDVVDFLNDLYSILDEEAKKFRMTKIRTVGQTYIAAAGMMTDYDVANDSQHPELRTALFSLSVQRIARDTLRLPNGAACDLQVGVASGPMFSAVVGLRRPQFDMFGYVAEVADNLRRTCEAACTQVDAKVWERLSKSVQVSFQALQHIVGEHIDANRRRMMGVAQDMWIIRLSHNQHLIAVIDEAYNQSSSSRRESSCDPERRLEARQDLTVSTNGSIQSRLLFSAKASAPYLSMPVLPTLPTRQDVKRGMISAVRSVSSHGNLSNLVPEKREWPPKPNISWSNGSMS